MNREHKDRLGGLTSASTLSTRLFYESGLFPIEHKGINKNSDEVKTHLHWLLYEARQLKNDMYQCFTMDSSLKGLALCLLVGLPAIICESGAWLLTATWYQPRCLEKINNDSIKEFLLTDLDRLIQHCQKLQAATAITARDINQLDALVQNFERVYEQGEYNKVKVKDYFEQADKNKLFNFIRVSQTKMRLIFKSIYPVKFVQLDNNNLFQLHVTDNVYFLSSAQCERIREKFQPFFDTCFKEINLRQINQMAAAVQTTIEVVGEADLDQAEDLPSGQLSII